MAELREDPVWYPRLVALAGCLDNELAEAGLDTCFSGVVTGTSTDLSRVFDEDGGMAWVRLVDINPLPTQTAGSNLCSMPLIGQIEVGYGDCFPVAEQGYALSVEQELDATRRVMAAVNASWRAIFCCDWGAEKGSVTQPRWTPGGPEGGAVWSTWVFSLEHY